MKKWKRIWIYPIVFGGAFFLLITCDDFIYDIDGNAYSYVKIGKQLWLSENLRTTKLNDGTPIQEVINNEDWKSLTTQGYCWINNNQSDKRTYGALYNYYTVSTGKLCPRGWHVPTDSDWKVLENYLGGWELAGGKMKEPGSVHWGSDNNSTNESGFTALPSGWRWPEGLILPIGNYAQFWSSTEKNLVPVFRGLSSYSTSLFNWPFGDKNMGNSVRCIANQKSKYPPKPTTHK
jgi:uncharacterized protein (TIGR02145 family)